MNNYQELVIPCVNKDANNVLYLYDILVEKRYQTVGKEISKNFNFYALNVFFDSKYNLVLKRPSLKKWVAYIVQYIKDKGLDLSKTLIISQYYTCSLIPLLNNALNNKIKKTIYVSPFVKFNIKTRKLMLTIMKKDNSGVDVLYNDVNLFRNNVEWVETCKLENVVAGTNIRDLKKIVWYFHNPIIKYKIRKSQKSLPYYLGLFIGQNDMIVNYKSCEAFFKKHTKKLKVYPFIISKLCCFEEENFKFVSCVGDFLGIKEDQGQLFL